MTVANVRVHDVIRAARSRGATDVHFGGEDRPAIRVDGRVVILDVPAIGASAVREFLAQTVSAPQLQRLEERGTADGAALRHLDGAPYRIHAWRHASGIRVAIRLLHESVPSFDALGLPVSVAAFVQLQSGLVLFAGPTGSGKTTALAAVLDRLNQTSERVIVTVEDPIEYLHVSRRSLVTQSEIARDVADYREALHGFLRADPDVIFIGELRDAATMEAALNVAETGHLVFATIHTGDAPQTIDRIVDAFPPHAHGQVRAQLAATLAGIVVLRLVPRKHGRGRRAAAEVLVVNDAIRALIREGKTHQIRNAIVTGRQAGMQTLESHLTELVMHGEIELSAACAVASRPSDVRLPERQQAS